MADFCGFRRADADAEPSGANLGIRRDPATSVTGFGSADVGTANVLRAPLDAP